MSIFVVSLKWKDDGDIDNIIFVLFFNSLMIMYLKGFLKFGINVLFLYFWKVLYTFIKRVNDCVCAADRLHKCEWPWHPSELFYFLDKLKDVAGQQLGLFEGSKVSTSRHERVRVDVAIPNLRQGLWTVHQFSWKGCKSSGHKNSCPRIKISHCDFYDIMKNYL